MLKRPLLAATVLLTLAGCTPPGLPPGSTGAWVTVHHPGYGVSYKRPGHWKLADEANERIGGPDGFVHLTGSPSRIHENDGYNVAEVGSWNLLTHHQESFTISGRTGRLVVPRYPSATPGVALVELALPIHNRTLNAPLLSLKLLGDREHLREIATSLQFGRSGLDYARGVLDLLKDYSYRQPQVDWTYVRSNVDQLAAGAATPEAAYPAVDAAIQAVGDPHIWFVRPSDFQQDVEQVGISWGWETVHADGASVVMRLYPGGPAEKAGLRMGDRLVAVEPTGRVTYERPGEPGRKDTTVTPAEYDTKVLPLFQQHGDVGYMELPGSTATDNMRPYRNRLQQLLRDGDAAGVRRWVIDVRRNSGGTLAPMLGPLATLLGEGPFGGEEFADGRREVFKVEQGRVMMGDRILEEEGDLISLDSFPVTLSHPQPPVAVLTGPATGSAGEFIVMGFLGRPKSRLFGEPTYGVPTGTHPFDLWDGAFLNIATARGIDRLGRVQDGPIAPDEAIASRYEHFATDADPVLERALSWLRETP